MIVSGCDPKPGDLRPSDPRPSAPKPALSLPPSPRTPVASAASAASSTTAPTASSTAQNAAAWIERRPYRFGVPDGVEPSKPLALVLYLHGLGGGAASFERALRVRELANRRGFAYAIPDGTPDGVKRKFWNATDSCCNFEHLDIDDVGYLRAVIDDASHRHAIDPKRVYVVGFSNGGFMAHRLACELSDRIAAIVSIAGAVWEDATRCQPSAPVAVLQIHGDKDPSVAFGGGKTLGRADTAQQPGARETVARWAQHDGCDLQPKSGEAFDLEERLEGSETVPLRYVGCKAGAVELWVVRGGNHFVAQGQGAGDRIWSFLRAHPKA
jgi:polyhydroxybutyrate depolymerase